MENIKLSYVLILGLILFGSIKCDISEIQRPENCDRQETLLQAKHVYIYKYTITTSSSFTGTTNSRSGSKITCKVMVSVLRKCEMTLQLSECDLQEKSSGEGDGYTAVEHADLFVQELERFVVYFQMDKGVVLENSIVIADEEPIHIVNIKRGILSQLQFPYMNNIETTEEKDIFGTCPVEYSLLQETPNTIRSKRDLRKCVLPQVFEKWFPFFEHHGGFKEQPISEAIYPFVSEVTCDYTLGKDKTLEKVNCFQQQYFFPMAFKGDILATAMANVSQDLELESYQMDKNLPRPSYDLDGRRIVQIQFEFGNNYLEQKGQEEMSSVLATIGKKFVAEDYDTVPSLFGDLLEMARSTTMSVLVSLKNDVFQCGEDCTDEKKTKQKFFLDALVSCRTDACQKVFLECIQEGHVGRLETSLFLQRLASSGTAMEDFLGTLLTYCKSSGTTSCWLSLGTLLSKTGVGVDADIIAESVLGQTFQHIMSLLKEQCSTETLTVSQREIILMLKTLENIGNNLVSKYDKSRSETSHQTMEQCIKNPNIPKRVLQAVLQVLVSGVHDSDFRLSPSLTNLLFSVLKDVTKDTTLRAMTFTLLMKTVDKVTVKELVKYMAEPNTKQLKAYMASNVQTLLENDDPTLKSVQLVWNEVRREDESFANIILGGSSTGIGISKTLNFAHFFKIPISDYFGGQLYMDLILDPSAILFSQLRISLNYFHGDQKYNVFEVTADVQGFDLLLETLLGKNDLSLMQLYAMYKQSKSQDHNEEQTLYDKFEKNLIKKVMEIIEQVNHPTFPNFELAVDLKMYGKHVHFFSLKDLMSYIHQLQAHSPPGQPTLMQKVVGLLKRGIHNEYFCSTREVASLVKQIPTCAGLPMNMTVRANLMKLVTADASADLSEYLQKTGPMTANWDLYVILAAELRGQLIIPVAHYHSSGISLKALAGLHRHLHMGLTYSHVVQGMQSNVPFSGTLQLDIWNVDKEPERVIYAKSSMLLLHHSATENVQRDSTLEKHYQRCFPAWMVAATGRSLCANLVYPDVKTSRKHAYFPLSGPFEVELVMQGADPDFDVHNLIWKFEIEHKEGMIVKYVYFTHYGKETTLTSGSSLNRLIYNNVTYNSSDRSLKLDFAIPEAEIEYKGRLKLPISPGSGFELMDFLWMNNKPYLGYFIKGYSKQDNEDPNSSSEKMFHVNFTLPRIGVDVCVKRSFVNALPELITDYDISLTYYCSQDLPFFYLFHWNPLHAAENGDVTQFHFRNNMKKTILSSEKNRWRADDTFTVDYPGQTVTMVTDMQRDGEEAHRNSVITYLEDGETVTVTMKANAVNHPNSAGMDMKYKMNIDADDFNILFNGKITGELKDLTFHMDAAYSKSENEARKKRSLEKIYDMFKAVKNAAVDRIEQIEEAIIGQPKSEVTTTEGQGAQLQFPPMPLFPSIWDLPTWTATLDLNVKAQPVFGATKGPPVGPPKGVQFVWNMDVTHPWNGGYRTYTGTGKLGRNMVNSFQNFHFWFDINDSLQYKALDGTDIKFPEFPNPLARNAHFHVQRETGHLFNTNFEAHAPLANLSYLILFDWEAIGHHEPLVHVKSSLNNLIFPFFNHAYEEFFTYEPGYAKHITSFSHKFLSVNIDTSFDYRTPEWLGLQNGTITITLPMLGFTETGEFTNKFEMQKDTVFPKLSSTFHHSSAPDRTLIYKTVLEHPKAISIRNYIRTDTVSDPALAWHALVELHGLSTVQVTFDWQEIYDQMAYSTAVTSKLQVAGYLQLLADIMTENMGLPIRNRKFIITGWDAEKQTFSTESPKTFIMKNVLPKAVVVDSLLQKFMANFVMLKHRQALMDQPAPYIPPRFRMLLRAAQNQEEGSSSALVTVIERLAYYCMKAEISLWTRLAETVQHHFQATKFNRKVVFAFPIIFVKEHFLKLPAPKHAARQVYSAMHELVGQYKDPQPPEERVAVVYGRRDEDRAINILTFDNEFFQIPADFTGVCSYLLMADVAKRNVAVMATPGGLSLVTMETTVTFGYDRAVYINDCKVPLNSNTAQKDLKGVSVSVESDKVCATTEHGVSLICFQDASDVCLISLSGSHMNDTAGLLGTNDFDKYTDRRLPDGTIADSFPGLVSQYIISGPAECHGPPTPVTEQNICNTELYSTCLNMFDAASPAAVGSCEYFVNSASFLQACLRESHHCDSTEEDICHAYQAYARLCEYGNLNTSINNVPDVCKQQYEEDLPGTGSLDIVFVVSQHSSMATGQQPWEYLFDLLNSGMSFPYNVRVGVVGFAGVGDLFSPYVLSQDGSFFVDLDDIDWSSIRSLQADGTVDSDGFEAIRLASSFPFNPTANKMIVLLMTKEQSTGTYDDLDSLRETLVDQNIILNVFSTYAKLSSKRVIGVDWQEQVISRVNNLQDTKNLPQTDYITLMIATKGAVFDIMTISRGRQAKIDRILEHFTLQVTLRNSVCPPAA